VEEKEGGSFLAVYLDVIWLLNLLFDSLLLYLTAIIIKRRQSIWRILAGGFIGSLIILLSFTPLQVYSGHPIAKLFCSVLMVLTAFGFKRITFFIKALMTLYVATFLLGGAIIGVHYLIQYNSEWTTQALISSVKGFGDPISWMFVLIGFPVAWQFSKKNIENIEMTKIQFDQIVQISLIINGQSFSLKGLIDSGNQLYDPLSKLPVMFVSIKKQMEEFPEPIQQMASDPEPILMGSLELPDEWQNRIRIVPCRVVGQEHQLIVAMKPDSIWIDHHGEQFLCNKGLISFTMQQLSADDAFQCIVHPKMLTGQKRPGDHERVG